MEDLKMNKRTVDFITVICGVTEDRTADPDKVAKDLFNILKDPEKGLSPEEKQAVLFASRLLERMYTPEEFLSGKSKKSRWF
jgi:hypothetical protein